MRLSFGQPSNDVDNKNNNNSSSWMDHSAVSSDGLITATVHCITSCLIIHCMSSSHCYLCALIVVHHKFVDRFGMSCCDLIY